MTIGLVCLSVVGVLLFLIVKLTQGRNAMRRKHELGRRIEVFFGVFKFQIIIPKKKLR